MAQFDILVQRVIRLLRQVAGSSVQTYSQDLIEDFVNQAFVFTLKKAWWPQYCRWKEDTLDGVLGIFSSDLTADADELIEWTDIKAVYPDSSLRRRLPALRGDLIPSKLTGTTPMYIEALPANHANFVKRVVQIYPKTATGTVHIRHRFRPKLSFVDDDLIHMDELMLLYASVYMYLKDDGAVPDMVDEYKNLFDIRFRDYLRDTESNQPIEIKDADTYPSSEGVLTEWH